MTLQHGCIINLLQHCLFYFVINFANNSFATVIQSDDDITKKSFSCSSGLFSNLRLIVLLLNS